ncbi:PIGR protein, partial [Serilophus lunatus]|nr:PIGR protein [Serilophus lunatus]
MTLLAFVFLLAFLPAESARSRHVLKSTISSPVFGPRQVYGLVSGSTTVKCFYPPTNVNRHDRKYWCQQLGRTCVTVVSTGGFVASGYKGRISITDYPEEENFQINISALAMADAGTYQCGVGINGRGLSHSVTLEVYQDPPIPEAAELFYVRLHSTWTLSCNFASESASLRRYLCKMENGECRDVVDSETVNKDFEGRVLFSYGQEGASFSVIMTQMDWEDMGLYQCGVGEYGKSGVSKELDVFIYEDKRYPQSKPTITAKTGSSATFECSYEPLTKSSKKTWCMWRPRGCGTIIDSQGMVQPRYEGRVAMFENSENRTITIILNQLTEKDTGHYWCMTDDVKEPLSTTELKVIEGEPQLKAENEVKAQVGSRVDLTCSYPCNYYSYEKYWCKWNTTGCFMIPSSDQGQLGPETTCNNANKTIILSFDSVTEADEGWYWCGVKRNGLFGETVAAELTVTEGYRRSDGKPKIVDVDGPNHVEPPQGGAYSDSEVRSGAASESSDQSHGSNTLAWVLGPLGGLLLIIATAFAIVKYRQMKRSDLVSIGSYRTNISMSDFESVKDYSASNSACVKESQETAIGGDEFITTTNTSERDAETKRAKRSSKEDADLAYSTFLVTSGSIAQGSSGGDSTVP